MIRRKTPIKETWYSSAPNQYQRKSLNEGEVGYIVTGIRDVAEIKIGDTLTLADNEAEEDASRLQGCSPHGI